MSPGASRPNEQRRVAIATIAGKSGTKTSGRATFTEANGKVTMLLEVENASPGAHAVHLHEKGDCSDDSAKAAGDHWNPTTMQHGKMDNGMSHSGDIGNITIGSDGKGRIEMTTDLWSVSSDAKKGIIGHSIIVHLKADDFVSQPSGNAGGRIGCGVITYEP
ncbi:MAG: superoxide dismutase family protein [Rhizobacter sp.]|nr:superoxide dismutase family protein [Chlorobiales bacterium]